MTSLSNIKVEKNNQNEKDKSYYSRLFQKFIFRAVISSVFPLLLVGWGISIYYSTFAKSRTLENFQERITQHQRTIEMFLENWNSIIQFISQNNSLEYLSDKKNLVTIFELMNNTMKNKYGKYFSDIGVIGSSGKHLAYIGPYNLMDRTYDQTVWFKETMEKGVYISDMFLGFRKVPHFIIAVSRLENGRKWILRATINAEAFRSLVEDVKIGRTGEIFILNKEGVLQTQPRSGGKIMDKISMPLQAFHIGIKTHTIESEGFPKQIVAHTWLKIVPWLLVIKQDYSDAFSSVNYVNRLTLVTLHVSALIIVLVSFITAKSMIKTIKKRDEKTDYLNNQLILTSKMAAIGELSAGVAHEVNNPLAIILTERQLLLDAAERASNLDSRFKAQLDKSLAQVITQIKRCKHTTQNLLRFSRRTKSRIEKVDLNAFLSEMIDLMEREAKSGGIKFFTDFDETIPLILSDPSQLQQVFLNMITNALDAHEGKPYGTIRITTITEDHGRKVKVTIGDKGGGIRPEHIEQIFNPFFTTKPVGKGTGLGLSICYSIIKRLGGKIEVKTEAGEGTEFFIMFPVTRSSDLKKNNENQ